MALDLVEPLNTLVLPALSRFGFRPECAISALSRAVLLAKITSRVCGYFILRERGGTVWAELRIAPPQFPDDRLRLLPGYCLEIGQCHDFVSSATDFLASVVQRATLVAPKVSGLAEAVEAELLSPIYDHDQTQQYARAMVGYEGLRTIIQPDSTPSLACVLETARAVAQGTLPEDHLASACVPLVKETRSVVDAFRDPIFQHKARTIGRLIAPHFFVEAVVGSA